MTLFTQDESIIADGVRYFNLIGFCYALPCVTNGLVLSVVSPMPNCLPRSVRI